MVRLEIQMLFHLLLILLHLHSSMVRLEILLFLFSNVFISLFTFQYGQIRNTMRSSANDGLIVFTFQYGQIRNSNVEGNIRSFASIYIPVWLDQKYRVFFRPISFIIFTFQYGQIRNLYILINLVLSLINLHSSMVRLEIFHRMLLVLGLKIIYIPVWLDQKFKCRRQYTIFCINLHSSMVRLEIQSIFSSHFVYYIYIPVWLDQKSLYIDKSSSIVN